MKLRDRRFLADQNIALEVVDGLREAKVDVESVRRIGLLGAGDAAIIEYATSQERVVLTHDCDFGKHALLAPDPKLGVVYIRPGHIEAEFTLASLRTLINMDFDVEAPFVIVAHRKEHRLDIRVRRI